MIKIAQLSDIHLGAENQNALDLTTDHIRNGNYDLIIVCGDLTQRGKRSEFEAAAAWLEQLSGPKLVVAGNHDTPLLDMAKRITQPFQRYDKFFSKLSIPVEVKDIGAYGLNTARGWQARSNWAEGSVNLEHLSSLTQSAVQKKHTLSILAAHHPFKEPPGSPLKAATRRGNRANDLLEKSAIGLFLYGHIHVPIAHVWSSENGQYLAVSAGTLSMRLRGENPSFNTIEIDKNRISITVQEMQNGSIRDRKLGQWSADLLEPIDT